VSRDVEGVLSRAEPAIALVRFPTSQNATAVAAAIRPALRPRLKLTVAVPDTAVVLRNAAAADALR
jgi:hypothetical protein